MLGSPFVSVRKVQNVGGFLRIKILMSKNKSKKTSIKYCKNLHVQKLLLVKYLYECVITALSSKEVEVKQRPSVSQVWLAALPHMSHWHFRAKKKTEEEN